MARIVADVTIRGVRPFFHHGFGPDSIPLEKQPKSGVAGNAPDEWRKSVQVIKDTRQLYINFTQVWASIRDGAKYTRKGRGSIRNDVIATLLVEGPQKILVPGCFLPENWEVEQLTDDDTQAVHLDIRYVKNPATRAGNVRYRVVMSPGWEVSFPISFDNTIVAVNQMRSVLKDAGTLCGVGDGRNIGMGRYEIVSFEVQDGEEA